MTFPWILGPLYTNATCATRLCVWNPTTGQAEAFAKDGLQTLAGQAIPADLVIYATGFDRKYDYLAEETLKALHQTEEGIPLYRDTIPTDVQVSIVHIHMFTSLMATLQLRASPHDSKPEQDSGS